MPTGLIQCLFLTAVVLTFAVAREREWSEAQDDDPPPEPRTFYPLPDDIARVTDGGLFKLRSEHDVVVLLAIHPYVCPKCVWGHELFVKANDAIKADRSLSQLYGTEVSNMIKFAFIDVEDEAPEFASIFEDLKSGLKGEEEYKYRVPSVLIFKKEHQFVMQKPPIEFGYTINNLKTTLVPFLIKLAGPAIPAVVDERHLMSRITHPSTSRVSIGVWADKIEKSVERASLEGRMDVLWHHLPSPDSADFTLLTKFNPNKADIVFYHFIGDSDQMDRIPDNIEDMSSVLEMGDVFIKNISFVRKFDTQLNLIRHMMEEWLSLRPGHEFDHIKKVTLIDDYTPSTYECSDESRRSKKGDTVEVRMVGTIVGDKTEFADSRNDKLVIGTHRDDFPDLLVGRGLIGMCPGMTRRMGFPSLLAFSKKKLPPGVTEHSKLSFTIEMIGFIDDPTLVTGVRSEYVDAAVVPPPDEL